MRFISITMVRAFYEFHRQGNQTFPVYAFILATKADSDIYPELFNHYAELHELTGRYMLVFAPTIHDWSELPPQDAARIMRQASQHESYAEALDSIMERQTTESLQFARICGIPPDRLPCIVFFDQLDDPTSYLLWEIHGTSAESLVRDFREIMAAIQASQSSYTTSLLEVIEQAGVARRIKRMISTVAIPVVRRLLELNL